MNNRDTFVCNKMRKTTIYLHKEELEKNNDFNLPLVKHT